MVQKHFLEKAGQKDLQQKRKQLLKIILQAKVLLEMSVQNIKLPDTYQLRTWIKQYNGHEILDVRI